MNYPNEEPFRAWMKNDLKLYFLDEAWVRANRLCVAVARVDMSTNFCVTAKREWVEENCPQLLTKYTRFLRHPEDGEDCVYGEFGHEFLPYEEENIGITYISDEDEDEDED